MQAGFAVALSLDELFYNVWNTGKIGVRERASLMSVLLGGASPEEKAAIDRILHAVRRGWIEMTG